MAHHLHIGKYFMPGLAIITAVLVLDQYTKWLVMEALLRASGPENAGFIDWFTTRKPIEIFASEREHFETIVLAPILNLVMVWNQGISFGMLDSNSEGMVLALISLSLVISMMLLIWLALASQRTTAVALSLIIGGALANVIDRIRFTAVMDFIDVHLGDLHWPAFNVADSCIVIGAGILMLTSFLDKKHA